MTNLLLGAIFLYSPTFSLFPPPLQHPSNSLSESSQVNSDYLMRQSHGSEGYRTEMKFLGLALLGRMHWTQEKQEFLGEGERCFEAGVTKSLACIHILPAPY